jgi:two-component system, cell cycle sensor histidine kinase and response regulator CckA
MLAYSGKGRFVIQAVNLSEVVYEMSRMLEVSISKKAILKYDLAKGLLLIEADLAQIQQIIMNLIINASEAIGDYSGLINIKTYMVDCDRKYLHEIKLQNDLKEGPYVCLEISDTGIGMDRETMSKMFDPFFSTKFTGRGLGLSAVMGIVQGHRGGMKVYSEPGKGSTFRVLFPAIECPAGRAPETMNGKGREFKGEGVILLADDEEAICTLGKEILEGLGFTVLTAPNGRQAIEVFKGHADEIKCAILDLTMPYMDGRETFRELRLIKPELPVIISSGYNEEEVTVSFLGHGLSGFIQKPFTISSIVEVLNKALC